MSEAGTIDLGASAVKAALARIMAHRIGGFAPDDVLDVWVAMVGPQWRVYASYLADGERRVRWIGFKSERELSATIAAWE